jgi:amidohydrolase
MTRNTISTLLALALLAPGIADAQAVEPRTRRIAELADTLESKVIAWRRDIHQNPELGNREFRTSKLVADHLRSLGLEVRTGIAHTGVLAVLKGGLPGPVVALRADMDALPVAEQTGLPFASRTKATWMGQEVGVAHVCGHDGQSGEDRRMAPCPGSVSIRSSSHRRWCSACRPSRVARSMCCWSPR